MSSGSEDAIPKTVNNNEDEAAGFLLEKVRLIVERGMCLRVGFAKQHPLKCLSINIFVRCGLLRSSLVMSKIVIFGLRFL